MKSFSGKIFIQGLGWRGGEYLLFDKSSLLTELIAKLFLPYLAFKRPTCYHKEICQEGRCLTIQAIRLQSKVIMIFGFERSLQH